MFNEILAQNKARDLKELLPKADKKGDEVDLVNAQKEDQLNMRLGQRNVLFLKKVEVAKQKLLEGTYGLCEDCGCEISQKRLLARPTACLCIDCQEEKERHRFGNINFRRDLSAIKSKESEENNSEELVKVKKFNTINDIGFESVVDM
jgi:DnaK suppressor protein